MKPIIFSTPMVQAILNGQKNQTRRVISKDIVDRFDVEEDGKTAVAYIDQATGDSYPPTHMARYKAGDVLWVRETWGIAGFDPENSEMFVEYKADNTGGKVVLSEEKFNRYYNGLCASEPDWRPSIHMPREVARLFLRVTGVRAKKLQSISFDDIIVEGIAINPGAYNDPENAYFQAQRWFQELWDTLNEKRGYGWDTDPWVWVYEFERYEEKGHD